MNISCCSRLEPVGWTVDCGHFKCNYFKKLYSEQLTQAKFPGNGHNTKGQTISKVVVIFHWLMLTAIPNRTYGIASGIFFRRGPRFVQDLSASGQTVSAVSSMGSRIPLVSLAYPIGPIRPTLPSDTNVPLNALTAKQIVGLSISR